MTTRLGRVRRFAEYLSAVDTRTEVPPGGLLSHRYHRKSPYFYRDHEVTKLIQASQKIPSPKGLRAASYSTLFGVLAATGMRLGEAIGLDRRDVDLVPVEHSTGCHIRSASLSATPGPSPRLSDTGHKSCDVS